MENKLIFEILREILFKLKLKFQNFSYTFLSIL